MHQEARGHQRSRPIPTLSGRNYGLIGLPVARVVGRAGRAPTKEAPVDKRIVPSRPFLSLSKQVSSTRAVTAQRLGHA